MTYKARMVGGACVIAVPLEVAGQYFDRCIWKTGQIVFTQGETKENTEW